MPTNFRRATERRTTSQKKATSACSWTTTTTTNCPLPPTSRKIGVASSNSASRRDRPALRRVKRKRNEERKVKTTILAARRVVPPLEVAVAQSDQRKTSWRLTRKSAQATQVRSPRLGRRYWIFESKLTSFKRRKSTHAPSLRSTQSLIRWKVWLRKRIRVQRPYSSFSINSLKSWTISRLRMRSLWKRSTLKSNLRLELSSSTWKKLVSKKRQSSSLFFSSTITWQNRERSEFKKDCSMRHS